MRVRVLRTAVLLLSVLAIVLVRAPAGAQDATSLRATSIEIVSADTTIQLELDRGAAPDRPVLVTEWVSLAPDQGIEGLLDSRGLSIDGATYNLIYALNPEITDLSHLRAGSRLKLPSVRWAEDENLAEPYRFQVDRPEKRQLQDEIAALKATVDDLGKVPLVRFGATEGERGRVLEDIQAIQRDVRLVGTLAVHDLVIVDAAFLDDVAAQADLVVEILRKVTGGGGEALSSEDVSLLEDVRTDLAVRSEAFVETKGPGEPPARYPRESVEVHTLSPDGQPVRNLRVFYSPPALCGLRTPWGFNGVSTPTTGDLNEATYIFWAGETPEKSLSIPHRGRVRKQSDGRPVRVDLVIYERSEEGEPNEEFEDPCGLG